jgi:hypothetical protein
VTPGKPLRVVLVKPSKYAPDGAVERFRFGFMPNSTLPYLASLTPAQVAGRAVKVYRVDEYVENSLRYLRLLERDNDYVTLVAFVGVQSHQLHRALDLAAYARAHGVEHVIIGGPHAMTCDTTPLQGRGVSFALAEAEMIWMPILHDALDGELYPTYGADKRWETRLDPPPLQPPSKRALQRYVVPMLGVYPARGCPYRCNFCSVIKIAGRQIRSQPVETTLATLRAAKAGGVVLIAFTTDNFNKYADAPQLLQAMIDEHIELPFFVQCDTQVVQQEGFIELLARAGCYQMFIGVESFDRQALLAAKKNQNHPERYAELVRLCAEYGIGSHFSNIIGFPTDTKATVLSHLRTLRALRPDLASFYILTPGPGTEQYDDFSAAGLLTERNLDRYDSLSVTWRHPHLRNEELVDLLYHCYRKFYALSDALPKSVWWFWKKRRSPNPLLRLATAGYSYLARVAAAQRQHPMAGGVKPLTLDRVDEYIELRRHLYGFDLAPLPRSLHLAPPLADTTSDEHMRAAAVS